MGQCCLGRRLFARTVGEQLHRRHVAQTVHELPRDHRFCVRPRPGPGADARQVVAHQRQIEREPDRQDETQPPIRALQQKKRRGDSRDSEDDRMDGFLHDLDQGVGCLDLLLAEAPGEIVLEELQRLAQCVAVDAQHPHRIERRHQRAAVHCCAQRIEQRPKHDEERCNRRQHECVVGKEMLCGCQGGLVHHPADQPGSGDLGDACQDRQHN